MLGSTLIIFLLHQITKSQDSLLYRMWEKLSDHEWVCTCIPDELTSLKHVSRDSYMHAYMWLVWPPLWQVFLCTECYAPFCSMAVRESFLTVDGQLAAAPGPAHYTPSLETHVKGGDSLKSKVTLLPSGRHAIDSRTRPYFPKIYLYFHFFLLPHTCALPVWFTRQHILTLSPFMFLHVHDKLIDLHVHGGC